MFKNVSLVHNHKIAFSLLWKRGRYVTIAIILAVLARYLFTPNILLLLTAMSSISVIAISLFKPKLYLLGLLVMLPIIYLTYAIRVPFLGLSSRPGVSGLNLQSFITTFSTFIFIYYIFANKLVKGRAFVSPILKPMYCLILINIFGLLLTADLSVAVPYFIRSVGGLIIFSIAFIFLKDRNTISKFMQLCIIALYVPIVIGYLELFGFISYTSATMMGSLGIVKRISCGYYGPLTIWIFMIFYYPFLLFLYKRSILQNIFFVFSFVLPLPVLYFTYYRTGMFILFTEILLWLTLRRKSKLALLIIAITVIFVITQWRTFSSLYESAWLPFIVSPQNPEFHAGFHGRIAVWISYLSHFGNQNILNMLFGMGPYVGDPHNNFLYALLATGVIGLGIFAWLLIIILREINFCIDHVKDFYMYNLAIMVKVIFVAFLILSITTQPSTYIGFQWFFFAFLSIIAKLNSDRIIFRKHTLIHYNKL